MIGFLNLYIIEEKKVIFDVIYFAREGGKHICLLKRLILFMEKDNYKGFIERLTMKDRHEKQKGGCNLM